MTRARLHAISFFLALGGSTAKHLLLRLGLPSLYAGNFIDAWERAGSEDIVITAAYSATMSTAFAEGNLDIVCLTGPADALGTPVMTSNVTSLPEVAGDAALALVKREPDSSIEKIVTTWPHRFETARAQALGFAAESSFDEIIAVYREDEMTPSPVQ